MATAPQQSPALGSSAWLLALAKECIETCQSNWEVVQGELDSAFMSPQGRQLLSNVLLIQLVLTRMWMHVQGVGPHIEHQVHPYSGHKGCNPQPLGVKGLPSPSPGAGLREALMKHSSIYVHQAHGGASEMCSWHMIQSWLAAAHLPHKKKYIYIYIYI